MNVAIRVSGPSDAAAVELVLGASYPPLMAGSYDARILAPALPMMIRANPALLSSGTFYLAEIDGEPAGCGGWTPERPGTGETMSGLAHLRHFGVSQRFAGRGLGRALYARCEAEASARGITQFECYSSLNGKAFYAAIGFVEIEAIALSMGHDVSLPSLLMRKSL